MEEAIESTILLVVLLSFAVVALAYAAPQAQYQIRTGEVRSAIAAMKVAAEREARVVTGDPSGAFDFNFPYGTFTATPSGNTTILINNSLVLYNDYHRVLQYKTNMGGYPATFVADRGTIPQAYYKSVDEASLAYHYTNQTDGYTYVVADAKIAFYNTSSTDEAGEATTTLHILVIQLTSSTIVTQRGPIGLMLLEKEYRPSSQTGLTTINFWCGITPEGQPLEGTAVTINGGYVSILLQVVYIQIQD